MSFFDKEAKAFHELAKQRSFKNGGMGKYLAGLTARMKQEIGAKAAPEATKLHIYNRFREATQWDIKTASRAKPDAKAPSERSVLSLLQGLHNTLQRCVMCKRLTLGADRLAAATMCQDCKTNDNKARADLNRLSKAVLIDLLIRDHRSVVNALCAEISKSKSTVRTTTAPKQTKTAAPEPKVSTAEPKTILTNKSSPDTKVAANPKAAPQVTKVTKTGFKAAKPKPAAAEDKRDGECKNGAPGQLSKPDDMGGDKIDKQQSGTKASRKKKAPGRVRFEFRNKLMHDAWLYDHWIRNCFADGDLESDECVVQFAKYKKDNPEVQSRPQHVVPAQKSWQVAGGPDKAGKSSAARRRPIQITQVELIVWPDALGKLIGNKGQTVRMFRIQHGVAIEVPRRCDKNKHVIIKGGATKVAQAVAHIKDYLGPKGYREDNGLKPAVVMKPLGAMSRTRYDIFTRRKQASKLSPGQKQNMGQVKAKRQKAFAVIQQKLTATLGKASANIKVELTSPTPRFVLGPVAASKLTTVAGKNYFGTDAAPVLKQVSRALCTFTKLCVEQGIRPMRIGVGGRIAQQYLHEKPKNATKSLPEHTQKSDSELLKKARELAENVRKHLVKIGVSSTQLSSKGLPSTAKKVTSAEQAGFIGKLEFNILNSFKDLPKGKLEFGELFKFYQTIKAAPRGALATKQERRLDGLRFHDHESFWMSRLLTSEHCLLHNGPTGQRCLKGNTCMKKHHCILCGPIRGANHGVLTFTYTLKEAARAKFKDGKWYECIIESVQRNGPDARDWTYGVRDGDFAWTGLRPDTSQLMGSKKHYVCPYYNKVKMEALQLARRWKIEPSDALDILRADIEAEDGKIKPEKKNSIPGTSKS